MKTTSIERLKQVLRYEPETGKLYFIARADAHPSFNSRWAGKEAITANNGHGYLRGNVDGTLMLAHRIAWALHFGEWPNAAIDHINGNRADNRIENLRLANKQQNAWNSKPRQGSSKFKGVSWHDCGQWVAQITREDRSSYIGLFPSEIEAAKAYDTQARTVFGEFARLNFPEQEWTAP